MAIFELFAAGVSPRAIAKQLNAEGVRGPGGREWRGTTIRGQLDRGTGILNNALYVGRIEWNRCSYVKDPRTGKKVARPNPAEQWEIVPVAELRIVSEQLWDAAKARQAEVRIVMIRDADGNALNGDRGRHVPALDEAAHGRTRGRESGARGAPDGGAGTPRSGRAGAREGGRRSSRRSLRRQSRPRPPRPFAARSSGSP